MHIIYQIRTHVRSGCPKSRAKLSQIARRVSWAIPEDKAGDIIKELICIRDEFLKEKEAFLADYDQSIENWINKHTKWASIIRESTVGSEYVRSRMGFSWQLYRVAPLMDHAVPEAVAESGLNEEVENLAKTLFGEIARSADEAWNRVYAGKTEVTHKALFPLRTLQQKLSGLTFIAGEKGFGSGSG